MGANKIDRYAPTVHGPRLKWHTPLGAAVLLTVCAWRFFVTGREVRGKGDNATWLHDATVDFRGRPVERLTRARWRRVAWRWVVLGVPWLLLDAHLLALLGRAVGSGAWWVSAPWLSLLALYATLSACVGLAYLGHTLAGWWPQRDVRKAYVYPTWAVVSKVLGQRYSTKEAVHAVALPPGFGTEDGPDDEEELSVRIHLPVVPLDEGVKKRLAAAAGERLGMPDPSAAWLVKGDEAYVDLSPRALPPRHLLYAEVRDLVINADPARPLVGLAAGRRPVHADLDNDGPHIGISGGTGTGKSSILRVVLSRRVRAGAALVVCDYKVTSHKWARRIAGEDRARVLYVTDEEEISEAILAVFAEFSRRRDVLKTNPDALDGFRDVDLLVEELNSLASMMRKWWGHERRRIVQEAKDAGESVPYVPTVPPAVDALAALVQMGRELRIRVHFAAQRLDASALAPKDGGAIRESITNRFLAKYTKAAWNMLCAGIPYEAFPGGPRGIWTAVVNGEVTHFRVPFMTDEEAYLLAMSGPAPSGPLLGGAALDTGYARPAVTRTVTLGEAWELIPGCPSLAALQKRVQREQVPVLGKQGNASVYDVGALLALYGAPAERVLESRK